MFCKECGRQTDNSNNICDECIKRIGNNFEDKGGFKYGFLAFLFPIAGIVLYYMLREKEPNLAKSFKIGSIISIIPSIIFVILNFTLFFNYFIF